jgi:hypothetical protein
MKKLVSCLETYQNTKGPTFITGDYNYPSIDWIQDKVPCDKRQSDFYQFVVSNGFRQVVREPTRGNNILDLVLLDEPVQLSNISVDPPFSTSDHNSVCFSIVVPYKAHTAHTQPDIRYLWNEADYPALCNYLYNVDWVSLLSVNFTADCIWTAFCEIIDEAVELYVPKLGFGLVTIPRRTYPRRSFPRHF